MQTHFLSEESVYSTPPTLQASDLDTETVVRFSQMFPRSTNSEAWSTIWRNAIHLSAAQYVLADDKRHGSANPADLDALQKVATALTPAPDLLDPVEIASHLVKSMQGPTSFNQAKADPRWASLRRRLQTVLSDSRELYLFLDAVDDNYHYAPAYWLQCQRGLFYAIMTDQRTATLDSKLHVVISIRDLVYSSVLRGEHGLRYHNDDSIVIMSWSWDACAEFLEEKLQRLGGESRSSAEFFGRTIVHNRQRNLDEPLTQYLLRHTRLTPRDVINVGNSILKLAASKETSPALLDDAEIRGAVAESATLSARSAMSQAGNQLLTNVMPWNASRKEYSQAYIQESEYTADNLVREICSILLQCESETFNNAKRLEVELEAERRFGRDCFFFDVLWQNRLVGYLSGSRPRYYRGVVTDNATLPEAEWYVINAIALDLLPRIRLADGAVTLSRSEGVEE